MRLASIFAPIQSQIRAEIAQLRANSGTNVTRLRPRTAEKGEIGETPGQILPIQAEFCRIRPNFG